MLDFKLPSSFIFRLFANPPGRLLDFLKRATRLSQLSVRADLRSAKPTIMHQQDRIAQALFTKPSKTGSASCLAGHGGLQAGVGQLGIIGLADQVDVSIPNGRVHPQDALLDG